MPVYSFNCRRCGEEFTTLVKKPAEKEKVCCPNCGSDDLRQLYRRFNYVKIAEKYHPECRCAANCKSAKKFGCGKYARDSQVPDLSTL